MKLCLGSFDDGLIGTCVSKMNTKTYISLETLVVRVRGCGLLKYRLVGFI